jgi:type III restriction enzyme
MEKVAEIINEAKIEIIMKDGGVTYIPLWKTEIYSQEKFANQEIINAFVSNTVPVDHWLYTHIIYDSDVEKRFAEQLNADTNQIKFFLKLPDWFKIDTPLGENYNPDRAILLEKNGTDKLYFVIETKSTDVARERRGNENYKIICWKKHFEAIGTGVIYREAKSYDDFIEKV